MFYAIITKDLADSLPLWHICITFDGSLHRSVSEEAGTLAFCQGCLTESRGLEGEAGRWVSEPIGLEDEPGLMGVSPECE